MKDLNWRAAFKRSGIFTVIWLSLIYFLNAVFPETFRFNTQRDLLTLGINAVFVFFLYAIVIAYVDRRRMRRMSELKSRKKDRPEGSAGDEDGEGKGTLRGRHNPNTSRKKARRRR